jgi:LacI family transcriptional regulator
MNEEKSPNRHTLRDVARHAGVSLGTASKALNKSGTLRQETRDRVLAAADELGFRPNDLAQALHRGQSFTVGLISNDSFGRFTMPIMEGLETVLHEAGIALFMCNATDDPEREKRHIDQLLGKRVDGLVFTGRRADRRPVPGLALGNLPKIYVFSRSDEPGAVCLLPDDEGGARLATEHLLTLGRKRIAHLTGPEDFEAVRLRRRGYEKSLAQIDPSLVLHGDWSEAWGRQAASRLLALADRPDAIFAGNDQIARGVVEALVEQGVAVPRDIAVVGFDNWTVMTDAARPPLTSVDMNLKLLGKEAGHRLIRMIRGEKHAGITRLPCTLVPRASTISTP